MNVTLLASPFANLGSIGRALEHAGARVDISSERSVIENAHALVVPGVGSFAAAATWLGSTGLRDSIQEAARRGASMLGICLGFQLLFESSEEGEGDVPGLGLLPGRVRRLRTSLPVPQVGWNRVEAADQRLFAAAADSSFYFVHSYCADSVPARLIAGTCSYGETFPAAASDGRISGVQFHPEKSSAAGIQVLRNFLKEAARC